MYLTEPSYDLQQGDVVLAPIVWVESSTQPPSRVPWGDFGAERLGANPEMTLPAYDVSTGYAPAVVVSHDCQTPDFVVVAPIVPVDRVRGDAAALSRGEVLGCFPVEPNQHLGIEGGVVDLTQLSTVDRMLVVGRLASMDDDHRELLRLALARVFGVII